MPQLLIKIVAIVTKNFVLESIEETIAQILWTSCIQHTHEV
jgi:hypothetical protein